MKKSQLREIMREESMRIALHLAHERYKVMEASAASPWAFQCDAVIYFVSWLALMDVSMVKHPRLKGCRTGIHGRRTEKFLSALRALSVAQTSKQQMRCKARMAKARGALLAAIGGSPDRKLAAGATK